RTLAFNGQLQQPEKKCDLPGVLRSLDGVGQEHREQAQDEEDGAVEQPLPASGGMGFVNSFLGRGALRHFRLGDLLSRNHQGTLLRYSVAYTTTGIKPRNAATVKDAASSPTSGPYYSCADFADVLQPGAAPLDRQFVTCNCNQPQLLCSIDAPNFSVRSRCCTTLG